MALFNLLKGSYTGKLGETTGQTWKGKSVVKASVFSKAPPTNAQTQSVRAFEALNRISSAISKLGFSYLSLSTKNLLPHNAVARFLRVAVRNHIFEPCNIVDVIPSSDSVSLSLFTFNRSTQIGSYLLVLSDNYIPMNGTVIFAIVFDDTGKVYHSKLHEIQTIREHFYLPYSPSSTYSFMAFLAEPTPRKHRLFNFLYKRGTGMQYSLDEQLTGDSWIDGRPIYQRTYSFTTGVIEVNKPNTFYFDEKSIDFILDYTIFCTDPRNLRNAYSGTLLLQTITNQVSSLAIARVEYNLNPGRIYVHITVQQDSQQLFFMANQFYFTVHYVKRQ